MEENWYKPNTNNGYCHCGCGGKTLLSKRTRKTQGIKRGKPFRFIFNHHIHAPRPGRKKRFCLRNHDTSIVGRTVNNRCRECQRERQRAENMTSEQIERRRESYRSYEKRAERSSSVRSRIQRMKKDQKIIDAMVEQNPWLKEVLELVT